jgi:hypothetical protein
LSRNLVFGFSGSFVRMSQHFSLATLDCRPAAESASPAISEAVSNKDQGGPPKNSGAVEIASGIENVATLASFANEERSER